MTFNENMIEIGGVVFAIDLEKYTELLTIKTEHKGNEVEGKVHYDADNKPISSTVTSREFDRPTEIDAPKYDLLRMCLEIILTYNDEVDDAMGINKALESTPISFKVAYNTLLSYGILKELEE